MRTQYMFPLRCNRLMESGKLPRIETSVSVRNHILLLIMTSRGENHFNFEYGSSLWESDFDACVIESSWAADMAESLSKSIKQNEPRIDQGFRVSVKLDRSFLDDNPSEIREKFIIHISSLKLAETGEDINDIIHTVIFSPLNID